jgi:hypothetical protein
MTLDDGRTRYTRGCRCDLCKTAERDYQRNRYRLIVAFELTGRKVRR